MIVHCSNQMLNGMQSCTYVLNKLNNKFSLNLFYMFLAPDLLVGAVAQL
jgi:hypothetical protein